MTYEIESARLFAVTLCMHPDCPGGDYAPRALAPCCQVLAEHIAKRDAAIAAKARADALPCDEELGRIANEASWPEGRKFPSDREVGAAIRAKLTGVSR
jgi:hypothetical protein